MESDEHVFDHVRECMGVALELDPIEEEQIERATTAADLDKWDSLSHLRLILELEGHFGIILNDEQIVKLASIERIIEVVGSNCR